MQSMQHFKRSQTLPTIAMAGKKGRTRQPCGRTTRSRISARPLNPGRSTAGAMLRSSDRWTPGGGWAPCGSRISVIGCERSWSLEEPLEGPSFTLSTPLSMRIIASVLARPAPSPPSAPESTPCSPCTVSVHFDLGTSAETNNPSMYPSISYRGELEYCSLSLVFSKLCPRDLVICQAVCRAWQDVAVLPEIRESSFLSTWGFGKVIAEDQQREWACLQVSLCITLAGLMLSSVNDREVPKLVWPLPEESYVFIGSHMSC